MQNEGAALYKKANMDLGDTIDAVEQCTGDQRFQAGSDFRANAIAVPEAFYKESGEIAKQPWEVMQKPVNLPKNPATWDSEYTAVADPTSQPGGIISVLELCSATLKRWRRKQHPTKPRTEKNIKMP